LCLFGEGIWEFIGLGFDETFEEFDFGGLRVPIVHHLIKKFIDDDEVVPDGLLLDIFEVAFKDIDEGVEKGEDEDGVVIFLWDGNKIEIIVFMEIKQIVIFIFDEWFKGVLIIL